MKDRGALYLIELISSIVLPPDAEETTVMTADPSWTALRPICPSLNVNADAPFTTGPSETKYVSRTKPDAEGLAPNKLLPNLTS